MHATGTFQVKISRAEPSELGREAGLGRMTIDKLWSGDIQGSSKGEMLTSNTAVTGSLAYAALELVTATLAGRSGSFYFLHRATMMQADPGSAVLEVSVVPQSGTGQLAGLTGELRLDMAGGDHHYEFAYELPQSAELS